MPRGARAVGPSGDGAPGDNPDGDGIGNLDEFRAGSSPLSRYRQYFGESSPGDRQQMYARLSGLTPIRDLEAPGICTSAIGDDGRRVGMAVRLDWDDYGTIFHWTPSATPAARILAIEVESEKPFVVERALYSSATGT